MLGTYFLQTVCNLCNNPVLSHFSHVLYDSLWPYGLYSWPGSSVCVIFQLGILEWVAMPSSRGSSRLGDQTQVSCNSCVAGWVFTAKPPGRPVITLKGSNYYRHFKVKEQNHRYIKGFLWSCTSKWLLSWALELGSFLLCHPASLYFSRDFFIIWTCIHLLWSAVHFHITSLINKGIEELVADNEFQV